ncbi:restriction endonuclease [Rhizobium sp. LjRoot254]|uniref:restriction endonuclease n=1 Tax=Rhizobium sp. LjRoot254 TaxID=3342297 RepID=UPI003ED0E1AB
MTASGFAASISEDAGERSGLALNREQIIRHLRDDNPLKMELAGENRLLRIGSVDYEDAVGDILYSLGVADEPGMPTLGMRLAHKLGAEWKSSIGVMELLEVEAVANYHLQRRTKVSSLDWNALNADLENAIGQRRHAIMDALLEVMPIHLAHSPFLARDPEIENVVVLSALFECEALPVDGSGFIDQRFINYLSRSPEVLKEIHWRQFEGLTAEWFARSGYSIELGPGRNDGGVDVRAWNSDASAGTPPALIVQCKREKNKVGKVVVKAPWADVHAERAGAGLIVTTNDISPGAANVIKARAYPITAANYHEVRRWLLEMRKPAAGVIL